jgi:hypothetical protein
MPNPVPGRTIGEHGIIGNLETAALVASDGTIDGCVANGIFERSTERIKSTEPA